MQYYVNTEIGKLIVRLSTAGINSIQFCESNTCFFQINENYSLGEYIDAYLLNKSRHLEYLWDMRAGTEFQRRVWLEMIKIPYGQTVTYSQIAERLGKPTAYRAVANACGANPIVILIPCHRVVAKSGLGGYSSGIERKKQLLTLEKINAIHHN